LRIPKLTAEEKQNKTVMRDGTSTGLLIVSNYLLQGVLGLVIMLVLSYTFMPDIFTAAGLLLPLSFGQGPGQANNIGTSYEVGYGFSGGASFGLALATMGFLWASIGGIIYINYLKRKNRFVCQSDKYSGRQNQPPVEDPDEIPLSEAVDRFTIQIALILGVYLVTYLQHSKPRRFAENAGASDLGLQLPDRLITSSVAARQLQLPAPQENYDSPIPQQLSAQSNCRFCLRFHDRRSDLRD